MNGPHDLGGLLGLGPIPGLDDERAFESAWEAQAFAILRVLIYAGPLNFDEFRDAVERLDPQTYDRSSYFERWVYAIEDLCVRRGLLDEADRARIAAAGAGS